MTPTLLLGLETSSVHPLNIPMLTLNKYVVRFSYGPRGTRSNYYCNSYMSVREDKLKINVSRAIRKADLKNEPGP